MADKYEKFCDNTMKDRMAFLAAREGKGQKPLPLEPSGFTPNGWDKYYFFSDPYQATNVHPTASKGRMRPAMAGPQTFNIEAFSKEDLAEARKRLGGKAALTSYAQSFSQIQVAPSLLNNQTRIVGGMLRTSSAPFLDSRARTSQDVLMGSTSGASPTKRRSGPHWPPADGVPPDPMKTRHQLRNGLC